MTTYTLKDVKQIYEGREVLNVPSLEIQQGEVLGIVGPSGAGKSTLLRLLALLEAPAEGTVALNLGSETVTRETATIKQRRQIAMVFQRPALLSRSVRKNVAYGLRVRGETNGRVRIDGVLDRVSMLPLADARPQTLSGGEMQRVAVARALVVEPKVLLLDEPTANLDPGNVRIIEELITEQNREHGTTIALVTHNIFQARRLATRVIFLMNGELVEVAPAEKFFHAPSDPRTEAFISGDLVY